MKEYKRTVVFIDKSRNKFTINCTITFLRNGYPEFTASGSYGGSIGQCLDSIVPANEYQQELVDIWNKWHLNGMNSGNPKQQEAIKKWEAEGNKYDYTKACDYLKSINLFEVDGFKYRHSWYTNVLPEDFQDKLDTLLDNIEEAEEERKSTPLADMFKDDYELYKFIDDIGLFTFDEIPIVMMFCHEDNLCQEDLDDIVFNKYRVTVQGIEYLAGTDSEMDDAWDEYLESYIDDCVIGCIDNKHARDMLERYFDREAWKKDARMYGRENSLNRYDESEIKYKFNEVYYYAYRQ